MKKTLIIGFLLLIASCTTSKEVVLSLTNPQDMSVSFGGYYLVESTGDSVPMNGVTPREYVLTLEKGEGLTGVVHKDGSDMTDTLHFRILVDDEEILTQKTTAPSQVIEFTVTAN